MAPVPGHDVGEYFEIERGLAELNKANVGGAVLDTRMLSSKLIKPFRMDCSCPEVVS